MKIKDIMTRPVESCGPQSDLAAAAMIMWRHDCGVVPVVDELDHVLGVVTDRDICIAVATRHRRAEEVTVRDVMAPRLFTVRENDDVRAALDVMRRERIRRVPVVDADRRLLGIVSMNDLVLEARPATARSAAGELTANDVLEALQAICAHPVPVVVKERPREKASVR